MSVPVLDGPFKGADLPYEGVAPASILLEGSDLPDGMVARYRFNAKKHGYVFKDYDRVALRISTEPSA